MSPKGSSSQTTIELSVTVELSMCIIIGMACKGQTHTFSKDAMN